jgi:hypothetical protein
MAFLALAAFALTLGALQADESPTATFRVIGLFEPERQEDLKETIKLLPALELVSLNYDTTEVTFRYDVSKLINAYNPKKPPTPETIQKNIDNLLRNASHATFTLKAGPPSPKEKLQNVQVQAGILDCRGCRYAVYEAAIKVNGVEQATVAPDGRLTAWIDGSKTNQGAIEEALKKARIDLIHAK